MRKAIAAVVLLSTLASCASIHHGSEQLIPVNSDPEGARVGIDCGDAPRHAAELTPTVITVPRKAERCRLRLSHEGYETEVVELRRVHAPETLGNLNAAGAGVEVLVEGLCCDDGITAAVGLFTVVSGAVAGGVGFAVDHATGAMYQQVPSAVSVELTPIEDELSDEEMDLFEDQDGSSH